MSSGWNQSSTSNSRTRFNNIGNPGNASSQRTQWNGRQAIVPQQIPLPPPNPQQLVPINNRNQQHVQNTEPRRRLNNPVQNNNSTSEESKEEQEPSEEEKIRDQHNNEVLFFVESFRHCKEYDVKQCLEGFDNERILKLCSEGAFPLHEAIYPIGTTLKCLETIDRIVRATFTHIDHSILGVRDGQGNLLIDVAIYHGSVSLVEFLLDLGSPLSNTNNHNMKTMDAVLIRMNPHILQLCMLKGLTCHQLDPHFPALKYYKKALNHFGKKEHQEKRKRMLNSLRYCYKQQNEFFVAQTKHIKHADSSQIINVSVGKMANFGRNSTVFFRYPKLGRIQDYTLDKFLLVIIPVEFKMAARAFNTPRRQIKLFTNPLLNGTQLLPTRLGSSIFDCSDIVHAQVRNPQYEDNVDPEEVFKLELHFSQSENCDYCLCRIVRVLRPPQLPQTLKPVSEPINHLPPQPVNALASSQPHDTATLNPERTGRNQVLKSPIQPEKRVKEEPVDDEADFSNSHRSGRAVHLTAHIKEEPEQTDSYSLQHDPSFAQLFSTPIDERNMEQPAPSTSSSRSRKRSRR